MYVTSMEQLTRKIKEYHGLTTHHIISEINKKFPNGNTYMRDLKEASIHSFNMGKGFRPAFLFLFNELFSEITDKTVSLSAAIETLHNSSLIHDDWMDKDEMRRGVITVWKKFGGRLAVLAGDLLIGMAHSFAGSWATKLGDVFVDLCMGQQMDIDFEN